MALALLAREEMIGIGRLEGRKRDRCAPLAKAMSDGSKNEVNFIGPRSYIHRPTKLYSSAYEVNFIFYPTFEASSHGMSR